MPSACHRARTTQPVLDVTGPPPLTPVGAGVPRRAPDALPFLMTLVGAPPGGPSGWADVVTLVEMGVRAVWQVERPPVVRVPGSPGVQIVVSTVRRRGVRRGYHLPHERLVRLNLGLLRQEGRRVWRRHFLGVLGHELVHARQHHEAPRRYDRWLARPIPDQAAYRALPHEVEAWAVEDAIRRALGGRGLPGVCQDAAQRRRIRRYVRAFATEVTPYLALRGPGDPGTGPGAERLSLGAARRELLLQDLTETLGSRVVRGVGAAARARAARWWALSRGEAVAHALNERSGAGRDAFLGVGAVRAGVARRARSHLGAILDDLGVPPVSAMTASRTRVTFSVAPDEEMWMEHLLGLDALVFAPDGPIAWSLG